MSGFYLVLFYYCFCCSQCCLAMCYFPTNAGYCFTYRVPCCVVMQIRVDSTATNPWKHLELGSGINYLAVPKLSSRNLSSERAVSSGKKRGDRAWHNVYMLHARKGQFNLQLVTTFLCLVESTLCGLGLSELCAAGNKFDENEVWCMEKKKKAKRYWYWEGYNILDLEMIFS